MTFFAPELGPKRLQLLREMLPGVSRVAVLRHPQAYSERTMQEMMQGLRAAMPGIELHVLDARSPRDFRGAFAAMAKRRVSALIILSSPMFYVEHRRIVELANINRVPAIYWFKEAVEAGGLISYRSNLPDVFRRSAAYVDKVLKGSNPGDLPVEQPTTFELAINLKTAKALGLTLPQSLLVRADEVIR